MAEFSILKYGYKLRGHSIHAFSNTDDTQCMVKCIENHSCRSYNIQRDKKLCEVNDKSYEDNQTALVQKDGWIYKSTDYSSNKVLN